MGGGRRGIVRRSRIRFCKMEWGAAGEERMNNVMSFRRFFLLFVCLSLAAKGYPWVVGCFVVQQKGYDTLCSHLALDHNRNENIWLLMLYLIFKFCA